MSSRDQAREWLEQHYGKSVQSCRDRVSAHTFEEDEIALATLLDRTAAEARDWSRMTPREAWEHAREMPKVAGPWRKSPATGSWYRDKPRGGAFRFENGTLYEDGYPRSSKQNLDAVDAVLRAEGWLLVDKEKEG